MLTCARKDKVIWAPSSGLILFYWLKLSILWIIHLSKIIPYCISIHKNTFQNIYGSLDHISASILHYGRRSVFCFFSIFLLRNEAGPLLYFKLPLCSSCDVIGRVTSIWLIVLHCVKKKSKWRLFWCLFHIRMRGRCWGYNSARK